MQKALSTALLLTGLFLSFFSTAQTAPTIGTCKIGTPLEGVGCTTTSPQKGIYTINWAGLSGSGTSANEARDSLLSAWGNKSEQCNVNGTTSRQVVEKYPLAEPNPAKSTTTAFRGKTTCNYTVFNTTTQQNESRTSENTAAYTGISVVYSFGFSCPPEGVYKDFTLSHTKQDGTKLCYKPFDVENCPTESDGNIFFHVGQKGGGSACVTMDDGSVCPFTESPTAGYYTPDYANPQACNGKDGETPNAKDDCTTNGAGQQVCKADPNEKCSASNGLLQCEEGCGYVNSVFMCFPDPEPEPEEPDEPDTPDPQPDDTIDNPDTLTPDMKKSDFKQVMRGIETRLESTKKELEDVQKNDDKNTKALTAAINGLGKKVDKTNEKLTGIQDTLDDTLYGDEFDDSGLSSDAAIKEGLGITGAEKLTDLKNGEISIDSFRSQFAPFLNTSGCPAPRSISIKGNTYTLEWTPFCDFFAALSYLVLAAAYLMVPFIVFGGKK